jgi:hypothetical protein
MKFIVSVLLTALLCVATCLYLPWWIIAFVAFLVAALIPQKPGRSFLSGFIALFLLWGSLALYISSNNNHILAHKVSVLFIKMDSPFLLIIATALTGAVVAGFAALAGSYLSVNSKM